MGSRSKQWKKQLACTALMGMSGVILLLLLTAMEERYSLVWLFALRGAAPAPADVVVIAIDQSSASKLGHATHVSKWPRATHADLIDRLATAGASVIAIDLIFSTCKNDVDDQKLASAIKKANNVVLVEGFFPGDLLNEETKDGNELLINLTTVEFTRQKICPLLADASLAQAPFVLPSTPDGRVSHHWLFATFADALTTPFITIQPIPLLPAVAMQIFATPQQADLVHLLQLLHSPLADELLVTTEDIEEMMVVLHKTLTHQPQLVQQLQQHLAQVATLDPRQQQVMRALIELYADDEKRYLNFYGPPRSIRTIPYYQILEATEDEAARDLKGKAVFVGISAQSQAEQDFVKAGDDYVTPFSGEDGAKLSGVEIAATAFANLLDGRTLRTLPLWMSSSLLFLLGFAISLIFFQISSSMVSLLAPVLITIYWGVSYYLFVHSHLWLPLVTPTVLILLSAIVVLLIKSSAKIRQFLAILKVMLPEKFEADARKSNAPIAVIHETSEGICMFTDIWKYSTIAEEMNLQALRQMMAGYFETLKEHIAMHDGEVIGAQGDEVHAIWRVQPGNHLQQKMRACLACHDIIKVVERFHQADKERPHLVTRVGLHFGEMSLRLVEASRSHAISATGDTVNVTKRIESANKVLGTQRLMSTNVATGLNDLLLRPLGTFILPGMSRTTELVELVARQNDADDNQQWLCQTFTLGLQAFQSQQLEIATRHFNTILQVFPNDGPARFYLTRCNQISLTQTHVIHL